MERDPNFSWGKAAFSVGAFGVYVMGLGAVLMAFPGQLLPLLGLPVPSDVWVRVGGMMMFFMGCFDVKAAWEGWTGFFRLSVPLRMAVPLFFAVFVLMKWAPFALIPMGFADLFGALWTLWALRQDERS